MIGLVLVVTKYLVPCLARRRDWNFTRTRRGKVPGACLASES